MNVSGIWDNIFERREEEPEKDIIDVIKNIFLFEDLGRRELLNVARIAYVRHYETGEDIIKEGQRSAGMYIIMKGEVEVSIQKKDSVKTVLTTFEKNDIFGELGLVDNSPRTATITTITPTDVIGFFRPELLNLINEDPKTASKITFKLAQIIAKRLRYTNEELQKAREKVEQLQSQIQEDTELTEWAKSSKID